MANTCAALTSRCGGANLYDVALFGLAGVGLLSALSVTTNALRYFWRKHLRPGKNLKQYGEWALVTGASDGIGRAYCDYLARQGLNIFLVSRTKSKLETAASAISQEHGVKTKILAIDLADAGLTPLDSDTWAELKAAVDALDIGVLINNAGQVQGDPSEFHLIEASSLDSTVALNDVAVLKVTHLVLPGMVNRRRGAIVNVSSVLSALPAAPLVSLYASTKGFLDTFSKSIAAEYGPKGIHVQVQVPGPVATTMVRVPRPESGLNPSPADFVKYAGRHIGYETACIPYPVHAIAMRILQALPVGMATAGLKKGMEQMKAEMDAYDKEHATDAPAGVEADTDTVPLV